MLKISLLLVVLGFASSAHANNELPVLSCKHSLTRYSSVPVAFFRECERANVYSAQAVDVYTRKFTRMQLGFFQALLDIDSYDESACATLLAEKYSRITAGFLRSACLH